MTAYYNENDTFAADWLRNLIAAGHIAAGDVDTRSIEDVKPDDLRGYTQCHFFAGIGCWSYALRRAGWPDDRPVWTGSCPCQPFSAAGKRGGAADERHLWPAFFHLIDACRPPVVFGEQVASKDGLAWLDAVSADMEAAGYAFRATDLCAAGVGAPHIRQRLYFVGASDAARGRWGEERPDARRLACGSGPQGLTAGHSSSSSTRRLGDANSERFQIDPLLRERQSDHSQVAGPSPACERPCQTNGHWRDSDWLLCRDGRWRPVESGTFPLVNGAPSRVGRLRAYGNAIVAELAVAFVASALDIIDARVPVASRGVTAESLIG